eukprot:COSAG02_NODE_19607_length_873_cov_1.908269_1_plen_35_part_10
MIDAPNISATPLPVAAPELGVIEVAELADVPDEEL